MTESLVISKRSTPFVKMTLENLTDCLNWQKKCLKSSDYLFVFSADSAWATDVGDVDTDDKPDDALFAFPSIRVEEVSSADFVDQPAANQRGLFDKIDTKPVYKMTKAELLELNESLEADKAQLSEENHQLSVKVADAEAEAEALQIQLAEPEADAEVEVETEIEPEAAAEDEDEMAKLQKELEDAKGQIASPKRANRSY